MTSPVFLDDSRAIDLFASTVELETSGGLDARISSVRRTAIDYGVSADGFDVDYEALLDHMEG